MSRKRDKLFSVEEEVAVHPELLQRERAQAEDEVDAERAPRDYYNSVAFEPGLPAGGVTAPPAFARKSSWPAAVMATLFCGVVGGLLAIPIIFIKGNESYFQAVMLLFFGPFAEETLKQSGMIFQLEKLPGTVRASWQFFVAALLGGLVFSVLENLLYQYVYLRALPPEQLAVVMGYRWTGCVALHVACTMISACGLKKCWREACEANRPAQVSNAFGWFVMAAVVHGIYNLVMLLMDKRIFAP